MTTSEKRPYGQPCRVCGAAPGASLYEHDGAAHDAHVVMAFDREQAKREAGQSGPSNTDQEQS